MPLTLIHKTYVNKENSHGFFPLYLCNQLSGLKKNVLGKRQGVSHQQVLKLRVFGRKDKMTANEYGIRKLF